MIIPDYVLSSFSRNKPLLILLQGASCSGKSTFANSLEATMEDKFVKVKRIKVNSYYKTVINDSESIDNYDFDNPAAIDWELMRKTFDDISSRSDTVQYCTFDFETCTSKIHVEQNTFPEVIILDGIYAMNLFNDKIFNVSEYDCLKPSNQEISVEYIDNPNNFSNFFDIFSVLFLIDEKDGLNLRIKRDINENRHYLAKEETKNQYILHLTEKYCEKILPSTYRWVNYVPQPDYFVPDGYMNYSLKTKIIDEIFDRLHLLNIIPLDEE